MNRNGSGAYDGTAYKAIMGAPKEGEIWAYGNKDVLVIKNHGKLCNVLSLVEDCKNDHCIEVKSKALKYTDPRMLQYVFNEQLGYFIKKMTDEDFDLILDAVEDALELNIYRADAKTAVDDAQKQIKELEAALAEERKKKVDVQPAQASDSVYKRLYDDLIDKLIDKKVM